MYFLEIASFVAVLPLAAAQMKSPEPGCATHCWDNSKYVTQCLLDNEACYCGDFQYQKVTGPKDGRCSSLYQCIYSQCETSHFASALQHITYKCADTGNEILFATPPIPDREELRRREEEFVAGANTYGSASAVGYSMKSACFQTESAVVPCLTESANLRIQSVGFITQSAVNVWSPDSGSSPLPAHYSHGVTKSPPEAVSTPTEVSEVASTILPSAQAFPQKFTNAGPRLKFTSTVPVTVTIFALCMWA